MCPLRETKVPNKSESGDPDPPRLTKGRSNHRLTRTRPVAPELQPSDKNLLLIYDRADCLFDESRAAEPPPQTIDIRSEGLFRPTRNVFPNKDTHKSRRVECSEGTAEADQKALV